MSRPFAMVGVLVLCVPLLLGAGDPADPERQFELVRTTDGPSSFELTVDMRPTAGSANADGFPDMEVFYGLVALRTSERGEVERADGVRATTVARTKEPGVFVDGEETSTCTAVGVCGVYATFGGVAHWWYDDGGEPDAPNRFYVAFEGAELDIRFEAEGWELHETTLVYRYVDYRSSSGYAAAITATDGMEVFLSAEADGGESGSIAMATPPCSLSMIGVVGPSLARGIGTLTLVGGPNEPSVTCPGLGEQVATDHVDTATTWRAEGPVIGDNGFAETRLFVIDLPECTKLLPGLPASNTEHDHPCLDTRQ